MSDTHTHYAATVDVIGNDLGRASRGRNSLFKSMVVWFGLAKLANEFGKFAAKTLHIEMKNQSSDGGMHITLIIL